MKISVITVNLNNANGLKITIESVINQTYDNIEYIIIDGGSTDGSKGLIEEYQDKFTYWISEPDEGIYHAMNKGIDKANGDYLIFINSGDSFINEFIVEKALAYDFYEDIVYGNLMLVSNAGDSIKEYPGQLTFFYFFHKGHLPHPASFISREMFERCGLYRQDFKIVSDWDFFVKALFKFDATYRHIDLVISRYDTSGISSKSEFRSLLLTEKSKSLSDNFPGVIKDMQRLKEATDTLQNFPINKLKKIEGINSLKRLNRLSISILFKIASIYSNPRRTLKKWLAGKGKTKVNKIEFPGSSKYWEHRYLNAGNSGSGSYGRLANYKADFINNFVTEHGIQSVIEMGCGDGNQLYLANYPSYVGLDVSKTAIELCSERFSNDKTKSFFLSHSYTKKPAVDLALSLDVLFHLVEVNVFEQYLLDLFSYASKYVIIYSSNIEERIAPHVRSWNFTKWIAENIEHEWRLEEFVPNKYQFDMQDADNTSISDFYIYKKVNT